MYAKNFKGIRCTSSSTVHKILRKLLNCYAYKVQIVVIKTEYQRHAGNGIEVLDCWQSHNCPRSPCITYDIPTYFFFCGYVKDIVYSTPVPGIYPHWRHGFKIQFQQSLEKCWTISWLEIEYRRIHTARHQRCTRRSVGTDHVNSGHKSLFIIIVINIA